MRRIRILVALSMCLIGGVLVVPGTANARAGGSRPAATAVIALVDSGINPYHSVFRDDSSLARRHPSSYIPGFPRNAHALKLSLNEKDYITAVHKDCKLWQSVKPGRLYWFPGTKIIGGITFNDGAGFDCTNTNFSDGSIIDGNGHGTMVASRAAGNGYGACPDCRIVSIQGFTPGVKWAARNSDWIDVQSNSWGPIAPVWVPAGDGQNLLDNPEFVRTVESTAKKHLAFWATGNGIATRGGVLGHPTILDPRMTPSIVMVGGHDSGYINTWPGFPPHVVADSCNSWAAYRDKIEESDDTVGSGTSSATPYAAGSAAQILIEARRLLGASDTGVERGIAAEGSASYKGPLADGRLRLAEWKDLLFKTATPRPKGDRTDGSACDAVDGLVLYSSTPVRWEDVPEDYPEYLHIGYGATDSAARQLAVEVLAGHAKLPDRTATDQYFETDGVVRSALHEVFAGP